MPETADPKAAIRSLVRGQRAVAPRDRRDEHSAGFSRQLRDLVAELGATRVACYLPVRGEPDTGHFIAWALRRGITVVLPAARPDGLLDWIVPAADADGGFEVAPGALGIPEPVGTRLDPHDPGTPEASDSIAALDLLLIPACAVDERGVRLGWGLGYYDRFLDGLPLRPPVFALVHDDEVFDRLPAEPHDAPVDGAVTPTRTLRFVSADG